MDATTSKKPKTMAELLPNLGGILSENCMLTLTAKKQPRSTMVQTRTSEKLVKPLTIAEMRADISAIKKQSPKRFAQGGPSTQKKNWNSSVKVDKTISHTANGQLKHNPVRKVLNFQPKPKAMSNKRTTMANTDLHKFPKPEFRAKKSVLLQARNNIRISGISNISETPVTNKPMKSRMTVANKENILTYQPLFKNIVASKLSHKKLMPEIKLTAVPDTPLSNESWKSSCDYSFLQKEKEINDQEDKIKAITEEPTLENIAEVTPPVSTPFNMYRSVQDFFYNSADLDNSAVYNDNTIMCFDDNTSALNNNNGREESVIVSICDLLKKTSVRNSEKVSTELEDLLEIQKQTEHNITALNSILESQIKSLQYVKKLINDKKHSDLSETLMYTKESSKTITQEKCESEPKGEPRNSCSVIKSCSKSPSYKIPKKNLCLRKKVFYKSMPNVSNDKLITPVKSEMGNRALSMYLKMKEHMNFLNTPVAKRNTDVPDTPAVTSINVQKQLDKLYG